MGEDRHLELEGCFNARDLGGLPTADGRTTRWRALVRSDALDGLTPAGWSALVDHGVRTVIDLRRDDELTRDLHPRPPEIRSLHFDLDGPDQEYWSYWSDGPRFGTPLYYRSHLERFPAIHAGVLREVARADPGGVLFHCSLGRDRTGLVALLLLALVGVPAEVIATDHGLSAGRLPGLFARRGMPDQTPVIERFLADEGTTAGAVVASTLEGLDLEGLLRRGGLEEAELASLRRRLVG